MNLIFQYSPAFIILCLALGGAISFIFYRSDKKLREVSLAIKVALGLTRFLVLFALFVFLLEPYFKTIFTEIKKPILGIAIDKSESIVQKTDSAALSKLVNQLATVKEKLGEKFDVQLFEFGDHVLPLQSTSYQEKSTDLSAFFREMEDRYGNQNYAASIILSDGILNKGRSASSLSAQLKAPVYTIGIGDSTKQRDALVKSIRSNKLAYLGNEFQIEVSVKAILLQNQTLSLSISKNGNVLKDSLITIDNSDFSTSVPFQLSADSVGLQNYRVSIKPISEETLTTNNSQQFIIEVLDGRQKILLVSEYPHPDVGAIRSTLSKNPNYEVDVNVISKVDKKLAGYNLVILHQLPSLNNNAQNILKQLRDSKIPVLQILTSSTNVGLTNKLQNGFNAQVRKGSNNATTAWFNNGFSLFSISADAKAFLLELPPLSVPFGEYSAKNKLDIMLFQQLSNVKTQQPMLSFHESNGVKSGIFVGEGIWKWRIRDYQLNQSHARFDEIISKTVQYLALKDEKKRFSVEANRTFTENENVIFEASLYDKSYSPTTEPLVSLSVSDAEGTEYDFTFKNLSSSYRLNAGSFAPGKYSYVARTSLGEENFEERGQFSIAALQLELINTVADFDALEYLSRETGGEFHRSNSIDQLATSLQNLEVKSVSYSRKKLENILNLKVIFFALLLLLSLEWLIRKRVGAY